MFVAVAVGVATTVLLACVYVPWGDFGRLEWSITVQVFGVFVTLVGLAYAWLRSLGATWQRFTKRSRRTWWRLRAWLIRRGLYPKPPTQYIIVTEGTPASSEFGQLRLIEGEGRPPLRIDSSMSEDDKLAELSRMADEVNKMRSKVPQLDLRLAQLENAVTAARAAATAGDKETLERALAEINERLDELQAHQVRRQVIDLRLAMCGQLIIMVGLALSFSA